MRERRRHMRKRKEKETASNFAPASRDSSTQRISGNLPNRAIECTCAIAFTSSLYCASDMFTCCCLEFLILRWWYGMTVPVHVRSQDSRNGTCDVQPQPAFAAIATLCHKMTTAFLNIHTRLSKRCFKELPPFEASATVL
jgi:hypothetical protein